MEDKKITRKQFLVSVFSLLGIVALSKVDTLQREAGRIFTNQEITQLSYGSSVYGVHQKNT